MKESLQSSSQSSRKEVIKNFILIFIFFLHFNFFSCDSICSLGISLDDTTCFNGIIKLNHINYRAGHFASNKNNDLIIEYSGDPHAGKRLFYGLKSNGRGFFNDSYIREKDFDSSHGRYESRNIFVSKKIDTNKEEEYLFSTSSYQSWTELYNLENDQYKLKYTDNFQGKRIFSYVFTLLSTKIGTYNYYFLFFTTPADGNPETEHGDMYVLKKFAFTDFNLDSYENTQVNLTDNKFGDRVISGYLMEEEQVIVILLLKKITEDYIDYAQYNIRFYNYNLAKIGNDITNYERRLQKTTAEVPADIVEHMGFYANCVYLRDSIGVFIYYHINKLIIQSLKFTKSGDSYIKSDVFYNEFYNKGFDSDINLNDVHKVNDKKIVIAATKNSGTTLCIILIDFYGSSYNNRKIRVYYYTLFSNLRLKKELSIFSYKDDFIVFSSTIGPRNDDKPYTSFLLFFSYPNGTDFTENIGPYLQDSDVTPKLNFFDFLFSKMKIENNIFRYQKVQKIKLVSIPNELFVYDGTNPNPLSNGSLIDSNCILEQNKDLLKKEQLYDLYYQYIAKEPNYNDLYYSGLEIIENGDYSGQYNPKEVYGRINKLSFKLCHNYCEKCYQLGTNNNDQYCVNCLSQYTYDYLAYIGNYTGNCVPSGEMYDIEAHQLMQCEGNPHKFYYNTSRLNEKYCFKYSYACPDIYHYFNETNNQCIDYTPPIPTTILKIPTTIPKINPTTIIKIPTTFPEISPTTIIKISSTIPQINPTTIIRISTTIPEYIPTTLIEKMPTTIKIKPPSSIIKTPTTIVDIIPSTNNRVHTTISVIEPTTFIQTPTTIPEKMPTTIIKIPTTLIEKTLTTIPKPIIRTIPLNIPINTIPEIIKTAIISTNPTIKYNCSYYTVDSHCVFANLTDEEIFIKLKKDVISTYPQNGVSVLVNGTNSYSFQVTNTNNENNILEDDHDILKINLGTCEDTLRDIYHIDEELSIIILKYFKSEGNSKEKNIYYELYHPLTHQKLNLSYCEKDTYELSITVELNEEIVELLFKALNQGYDIFDPESSFYKKICTPYTSENGTDVLLDDRISFYYNKVQNITACPDNCKYVSYSTETKFLKCECGVSNADISTLDLKNIIGSNTYKSFYSTLKYSNYKVMICYNLVFNFKLFFRNYGSIITLILFIIYLIFIILYAIRNISPLKIDISKLLFKNTHNFESKEIQINKVRNNYDINKSKAKGELIDNNEKINKGKFPPKKRNNIVENDNSCKTKSINEKIRLINNPKNIINKNLTNDLSKKNSKNNDVKKSTNVKKAKSNLEVFTIKSKKSIKSEKLLNNEIQTNKKLYENKSTINLEIRSKYNEDNTSLKFEDLDNFELNNLEYIPAYDIDKRSFLQTYWSVLLREHIALITFFAWNDYNLFYIKFNRFLIQFCTNMTMNGLFFSDETMHNLYVNSGEYNIIQQIPQILYSLVVGHVLEVILCYLSLTDTSIYEIKELSKNKENAGKILQILRCMRIKLIFFFVFTFILFCLYWYFISAFCAVYKNTQKIFIMDSLMSFFTSMIDPFIIYALTTILRTISLARCGNKKLSFIYGVSQFFPIF